MDLSNRIDSFIINKGKPYGQYLGFGYPIVCMSKTKELIVYKDILLKMHEGLLWEEKGLKVTHPICPNEFPKLKSGIIAIIGNQTIQYTNEVRDESNMDEWLLKNPKCVSFDRWKRVFYNLCFSPEITVTPIIENKCKFIYSVVSKENDQCEIISKAVIQADKKCAVDYSVKIDEGKCKLEYNAIIKKGECEIEYSAFESAKKCGFTAKSIAALNKCGVSIKSDPSDNDCVILTTSAGEISCNKTNYKFIINNIQECSNIQ
jgi:hypothetical protein